MKEPFTTQTVLKIEESVEPGCLLLNVDHSGYDDVQFDYELAKTLRRRYDPSKTSINTLYELIQLRSITSPIDAPADLDGALSEERPEFKNLNRTINPLHYLGLLKSENNPLIYLTERFDPFGVFAASRKRSEGSTKYHEVDVVVDGYCSLYKDTRFFIRGDMIRDMAEIEIQLGRCGVVAARVYLVLYLTDRLSMFYFVGPMETAAKAAWYILRKDKSPGRVIQCAVIGLGKIDELDSISAVRFGHNGLYLDSFKLSVDCEWTLRSLGRSEKIESEVDDVENEGGWHKDFDSEKRYKTGYDKYETPNRGTFNAAIDTTITRIEESLKQSWLFKGDLVGKDLLSEARDIIRTKCTYAGLNGAERIYKQKIEELYALQQQFFPVPDTSVYIEDYTEGKKSLISKLKESYPKITDLSKKVLDIIVTRIRSLSLNEKLLHVYTKSAQDIIDFIEKFEDMKSHMIKDLEDNENMYVTHNTCYNNLKNGLRNERIRAIHDYEFTRLQIAFDAAKSFQRAEGDKFSNPYKSYSLEIGKN